MSAVASSAVSGLSRPRVISAAVGTSSTVSSAPLAEDEVRAAVWRRVPLFVVSGRPLSSEASEVKEEEEEEKGAFVAEAVVVVGVLVVAVAARTAHARSRINAVPFEEDMFAGYLTFACACSFKCAMDDGVRLDEEHTYTHDTSPPPLLLLSEVVVE